MSLLFPFSQNALKDGDLIISYRHAKIDMLYNNTTL